MKALRIIKKSKQLYRSVESQSREIIANIYANTIETDKLELDLKEWSSNKTTRKAVTEHPILRAQQPLKNLLVLLEHLSKGYYLDICSFIFLSKQSIYIVFKEKQITIKKVKNEKSKLKYWFSDIYFTRLRNKLAEQLLDQNFKSAYDRQVIHFNEEKQYMPSCVSGKKENSTLIRQIKISRSSMYRKQGELERQQFCVGYYHNGAQQLFSFSEILSFAEYPFNLSQISYFKILKKQKEGSNIISTSYSRKYESKEDNAFLEKLRRMMKKEERWEFVKGEVQDLKNKLVKNEQYQSYCHLLMLQIIGFVEIQQFIEMKQIKLEWTITVANCVVLSNASTYRYVQINKIPQSTQGLVTLYEKCQFGSRIKHTENSQFSAFKKNKSAEKYINGNTAKLPLLNWQKKKKESVSTLQLSKAKNKAHSCVLRTGLNHIITS